MVSENGFQFLDPGELIDRDLQLLLKERRPANPSKGYAPVYMFDMVLTGTTTHVGSISFRVGDGDFLVRFAGHFGYEVEPEHRGQRFSVRACQMLFPLARAHGLKHLWLTVTPENAASRRTCEILGATMVEIVDLPADCDMYARGERQKCRYRIDL